MKRRWLSAPRAPRDAVHPLDVAAGGPPPAAADRSCKVIVKCAKAASCEGNRTCVERFIFRKDSMLAVLQADADQVAHRIFREFQGGEIDAAGAVRPSPPLFNADAKSENQIRRRESMQTVFCVYVEQ